MLGHFITRTLVFLLPLALTVSCAKPVGHPPQTSQSTTASKSPIVAALTHFRSLKDIWIPGSSVSNRVLLVDRRYETSKGFIDAAQLNSDTHQDRWTLPEDARLDMERRTDARERFRTPLLPSFIRILDFEKQPPGNSLEFSKRHPQAKCYIVLWPPGYTRDRSRAVVRFLFGPTPHGASAVYLLELRDGEWHVVRHSVSYYA